MSVCTHWICKQKYKMVGEHWDMEYEEWSLKHLVWEEILGHGVSQGILGCMVYIDLEILEYAGA